MCGGLYFGEVKTLYGMLLHCIPFPFPQRRNESRNGTRVAQVQPDPVRSSECPKLEWGCRRSWTPNCRQRCRSCSKSDVCMIVTFHSSLVYFLTTPHHTTSHTPHTTSHTPHHTHHTTLHPTPPHHTPHHTTSHYINPLRMYLFSVCIIYSTHVTKDPLYSKLYVSILLYELY